VDVVIITPEKGKAKEIGQQLLALADNPRDVQWVTWPAAGFSVPVELFAKFDADEPEAAEEETQAPKRRRRRSKDSTDNNTSEEE
jgi:hypothetical protein